MEENLRNIVEDSQERGPLQKGSLPTSRCQLFSPLTSSPALQRPPPWILGNCMPKTSASKLHANTSTSGELQGPVDPSGTYNDVDFG